MDASIIIPTYQRHQKLQACLRALGQQTTDRFEVLVGFDGPDPKGVEAALQACSPSLQTRVKLIECPKSGLTAVRNQILREARGRVMISTNDDVVPDAGWVAAHVAAHAESRAKGQCIVVVGSSPWVAHQPDRLFDRMIRETSMVFFYAAMDTPEALAQPDKDWGFRHAWGLNFSAPLEAVREVGNFTVFPAWYGYEDNEIAFKLRERFGAPVLYRAQARLWHDHRMEPDAYLKREFSLGYAALGFAQTSTACARAMFGRDVHQGPELSYSREFVARERTAAARCLKSFRKLVELPVGLFDLQGGPALRDMLYEQHLLLKRWMWRAGLIAAVEKRDIDQVIWPE